MKVKILKNNEIPNFTPEFKNRVTSLITKYVEKRFFYEYNKYDVLAIEDLDDEFKTLGFKWIRSQYKGMNVTCFLFHKERNLIIKFNSNFMNKKPRKSCPTYMIDIIDDSKVRVVVQPMLDTKSPKARKMIAEHYKFWRQTCGCDTISGFSDDAHDENVGLYNGKLVQFDW